MEKIFLAILLLGWSAQAKDRVLTVITFDYPPYMVEKQPDGRRGIDIEIIEELLASKWELKYTYLPMRRAVTEMKQKARARTIHMGTSAHFTSEIQQNLFKKVKIGSAKFVTYARADFPRADSKDIRIEDLVGRKVAALRGSSVVPTLLSHGIEVLEVGTFEQLFKVLERHRVEASIVLEFSGDSYLSQKGNLIKKQIFKMPGIILQIPTDIIIPQGYSESEEIYVTLLTGISLLKESGRLRKILESYDLSKEVIESFLADFGK